MPKGKKVLFKIPSEEELKKEAPKEAVKQEEIPADLPVVEPEAVATNLSKPKPNPPPKKPEAPKPPEAKKPEPKKEEKLIFRRPDEKLIKDAGPGPDPGPMVELRDERKARNEEKRRERLAKQSHLNVADIEGISVGPMPARIEIMEPRRDAKKRMEKLERLSHDLVAKEEQKEAKRDKKKRMEKVKTLSLDLIEGITVGSPTQAQPKNARRITRDRRREALQNRRATMKVMINGEEKEVSETSKYLLDMLTEDK